MIRNCHLIADIYTNKMFKFHDILYHIYICINIILTPGQYLKLGKTGSEYRFHVFTMKIIIFKGKFFQRQFTKLC